MKRREGEERKGKGEKRNGCRARDGREAASLASLHLKSKILYKSVSANDF